MTAPSTTPIAPPPVPGPPPPLDASDEAHRRTAARRRAAHTEPAREAPVVPRLPIIGNVLGIRAKGGLIQFLEDAWRTYGDVFRFKAGFDGLVVAHPDGIARILAEHVDNYVKGATYDGARRILGNGVLTREGAEWRSRRRLLQPSFHRSALEGMAAVMIDTSASYFADLHRRLPEGGVVDVHREMVKLTLDVVVAALFGRDQEGAAAVSYESLGDALELVSELANGIPLPEWIPTPGNLKLKRTLKELEGAVYQVIATARKRPNLDDGTLLGMLLSTRDADTGELLPDVDVRDEVFTLFVAGHETTALTLTWLFTLLEGRDDVIAKMREEVARVLGDRDPGFADVPRLSYLRQVVDETLRLRGPVALNARTAVHDDNILGFKVHAGDIVMPLFWGAHRHPAYWTDPLTFDPGRFTPEANGARDPWSYVPFSAGRRVCIGNTFSLVESVLILAMLLQRFDFAIVPGQTIVPNVIATVRPSAPVMVKLEPRGRMKKAA